MAEVRDHPWVTGVKPAEPNDQGSYNTHDMVGEDDEPVYRGMGALPSEFEADAMVDDDAPVYRSLGFSEPPPAPGLARQKGNADLTQRAPDVWGSLDLD